MAARVVDIQKGGRKAGGGAVPRNGRKANPSTLKDAIARAGARSVPPHPPLPSRSKASSSSPPPPARASQANARSAKARSIQGEAAADLSDEAKLQHYDTRYLECRTDRHTWERVGFYDYGGLVAKLLQCPRCQTKRLVRMRRNGLIVDSRYDYPDDYRIAGGVEVISVRAADLARATIWGSEAEMMDHVMGARRRNGKGAGAK